jgi:hypothetical protein
MASGLSLDVHIFLPDFGCGFSLPLLWAHLPSFTPPYPIYNLYPSIPSLQAHNSNISANQPPTKPPLSFSHLKTLVSLFFIQYVLIQDNNLIALTRVFQFIVDGCHS